MGGKETLPPQKGQAAADVSAQELEQEEKKRQEFQRLKQERKQRLEKEGLEKERQAKLKAAQEKRLAEEQHQKQLKQKQEEEKRLAQEQRQEQLKQQQLRLQKAQSISQSLVLLERDQAQFTANFQETLAFAQDSSSPEHSSATQVTAFFEALGSKLPKSLL